MPIMEFNLSFNLNLFFQSEIPNPNSEITLLLAFLFLAEKVFPLQVVKHTKRNELSILL